VLTQALVQQSGIQDIRVIQPAKQDADRPDAAPITYGDQTLGTLTAGPNTPSQTLVAWSHWAARWVAMQQRIEQLSQLSMRDELTGVWNRRYFNRFLNNILDRAKHERQQVTVMVFDIDDFKTYNDRYGHAAGDEILEQAAQLMQSVVREHDVVARIGGDEFAVIFWDAEEPRQKGSRHPQDVRRAAERFQQAVFTHRFPKLGQEAHGTLTISGGLASYPWDAQTAAELVDQADLMAMQSKRQGKNALTFGPGATRQSDPA